MGQLDELWEWLPIRVMKRQGELLDFGSSLRGYIYRNWRGNYFLLDQECANRANEAWKPADDETSAEVTTVDQIAEALPLQEEDDRLRQLEEMWEQAAKCQGSQDGLDG
jgi:hypothetical protein